MSGRTTEQRNKFRTENQTNLSPGGTHNTQNWQEDVMRGLDKELEEMGLE